MVMVSIAMVALVANRHQRWSIVTMTVVTTTFGSGGVSNDYNDGDNGQVMW